LRIIDLESEIIEDPLTFRDRKWPKQPLPFKTGVLEIRDTAEAKVTLSEILVQ
jgi:hypothetical protein